MLVAHVWLVTGGYPGMQSPRSGAERDSVMFWLTYQEPYIIQPGAYGVYKSLIQPSNNKSRPSYRLHNVRMGYVLYRALVS